jgi:hypothetical protein
LIVIVSPDDRATEKEFISGFDTLIHRIAERDEWLPPYTSSQRDPVALYRTTRANPDLGSLLTGRNDAAYTVAPILRDSSPQALHNRRNRHLI